jgi:hypothetical protein
MENYKVHVRFKHPAWDERDGYCVYVESRSKSDAIKSARRQMRDAGHGGVKYFTATKTEEI